MSDSNTLSSIARRTFLLGVVLAPLTSSASSAATPKPAPQVKTAQQVVEEMVREALGLLRNKELQKKPAERKQRLRAVADRAFDWEAMARGSLGPYWRELTAEQRTEFVRVLKALIANQYMDDVDRFRGNEDVKVLSANTKESLVFVKTVLITASNEKVPMDYTLHQGKGAWMIEDLAIEGVSMVAHYRQSFRRFLVNKSFAELLETLKRKLNE